MKDIEIKISKETRQVSCSKNIIGNDGENLQGNFIFSFLDEIVEGQARLEYSINNKKAYQMLEKEGDKYKIPIKSVMTKKGKLLMQLVIGTNEEEIPIFKSSVFSVYVRESINAEAEQPDEYLSWIEVANTKLNQIDNLDIGVSKVDNVSTLTITKADGTKESVEILDGEKGEKGDAGECNFATFEIENGSLIMNTNENMLLDFKINENGELEVVI